MPSAEQFFGFIRKNMSSIPFARQIVAMYFCMIDEDVPWWAKAVIGGALVYVITPLDAIPDFIPVAGWTDDAAAVATAVAQIGGALNEKHYRQADEFLYG